MLTQGLPTRRVHVLVVLGALALVPTVAHAQSSAIAGVVKDPSGAVLPGVTVEQRTLDELIQAIPSARAYNGIVRLIPSITAGGNDVVPSPGMITGQFDF